MSEGYRLTPLGVALCELMKASPDIGNEALVLILEADDVNTEAVLRQSFAKAGLPWTFGGAS